METVSFCQECMLSHLRRQHFPKGANIFMNGEQVRIKWNVADKIIQRKVWKLEGLDQNVNAIK
jgi:hypothetical protein